MASLQARHTRKCALHRPWTTFAAAAPGRGCTCQPGPMYHVVSRIRRSVGARADRSQQDVKRSAGCERSRSRSTRIRYAPPENVSFAEWADRWLAGLRREETTRRTYQSSLVYAKQVIGSKPLRKVTTSDVRAFLDHIERVNRNRETPRDVSRRRWRSTCGTSAACLQAAKTERLIGENPVRLLAPSAKPKAQKKRPSYFTDDELAPAVAGTPPADR